MTRATLLIVYDRLGSPGKEYFWELAEISQVSAGIQYDTLYRSRGAAEAAARRWAERHNIKIKSVMYG